MALQQRSQQHGHLLPHQAKSLSRSQPKPSKPRQLTRLHHQMFRPSLHLAKQTTLIQVLELLGRFNRHFQEGLSVEVEGVSPTRTRPRQDKTQPKVDRITPVGQVFLAVACHVAEVDRVEGLLSRTSRRVDCLNPTLRISRVPGVEEGD